MSTRPPLTLYVHLPWCVRKCPYCDFNSHAARAALPEDDYVTALLRDLEQEWPNSGGRPIETIFLGGGTPSLFSPESIARLIRGIRERADLHTDAEITLEANPAPPKPQSRHPWRAALASIPSAIHHAFRDIAPPA